MSPCWYAVTSIKHHVNAKKNQWVDMQRQFAHLILSPTCTKSNTEIWHLQSSKGNISISRRNVLAAETTNGKVYCELPQQLFANPAPSLHLTRRTSCTGLRLY